MRALLFPTTLAAAMFAVYAHAEIITINGADDIYGAGQTGTPGVTDASVGSPGCATSSSIPCGGYIPAGFAVSGGDTITFSSVTGTITLNSGGNFNDANGVGAGSGSSSNSGANNISGLTAANAGYLVGVFLAAGGPSGPTPTALDFSSGSPGSINFTSLSPALDQAFFVGDGNNGGVSDDALQDFIAPAGASELYLGISDACGYNGAPGCYDDNLNDDFTATYAITAAATTVPEPASLALLGSALAGLGFYRRRKRKAA